MDNRTKELIIGYDLCNDYTQISCYNQKTQDIDTICYIGQKMMDRIPTVLCLLGEDEDSWVCGYEAWKAVNERRGVLVENFAEDLESDKFIKVAGRFYTCADLTRIFIRESLNLLTKYYPHWHIGQLTVAVEKFGKGSVDALRPLCQMLSFEEKHLNVISHVSAYEYYALNQKKELWQHDVGLFDYSKKGMTYYHLSISKKRTPAAAMATTIPLQEYLNGSEIGEMSPPELDRRFFEIVQKVTANKIISTVYLTGEGFDGDWAHLSLKTLCHHRKGFIGSNIFSRGACYYSLQAEGLLTSDRFIALNDDVISRMIYVRGSKKREMVNEELVKAGQVWYDVQSEITFIPENTDHVTLHLLDYVGRNDYTLQIPLDEMDFAEGRPDRTHYIRMNLFFEDVSKCHVTLQDMGFGEFYPPANKTIEKVFDIYDDKELESKEGHETGRLILTNNKMNTVPFYFNLSGMRVYSCEELCYYIYQNIYAVSDETFGEDLIYWIDKNLEERGLVKRLREAKKNKRTVKEMVRTVLMSVDYYSKDEVEALQGIIEEIEMQNPIENRKVEGDNYLRYGKLLEAVETYKKVDLMVEESEEEVCQEFLGNVYHNMGAAFAKLGHGSAALECFSKAFELNHSETSRDSMMMMMMIMGMDEEMMQETGRMNMAPEEVSEICRRFDEAKDAVSQDGTSIMIEKIKDIHSESQWDGICPEILEWLEKQKGEYRNL